MNAPTVWRTFLALPALMALAMPASAHHAMGGKMPSTFMEGLLSGLGHPIIGPDHFAFILAIGIAAAFMPAGIGLVGSFLLASTAGVLAHVGMLAVPFAEPLVAATVIAAAALFIVGNSAHRGLWLILTAAAGILHGYAFAESIVGVERNVLGAYLLGLALASAAVALGVTAITRHIITTGTQQLRFQRASGIALGVVGVALLASHMLVA